MKYSLHTALNVVDPAAYNGWPGYLNGPCGDAQALASELALAGFETKALINDRATLTALADWMDELASKAIAGDTVILHHSHHGGRQDYGVFVGYTETFCLYDGELADVRWMELIAKFKVGVNLIAILDCCHSGGMDRAGSRSTSKARPAFVRGYSPLKRSSMREPVACNFVGLPACQADETCIETQIPEVAGIRGAWTWSIVRQLQQARSDSAAVLLPDLFNAAARYCAEHFPNQHPRVLKQGPDTNSAWNTRIA